ncbi:MAG: hypothetical protein GF311_24150 [Candidatus Lokiarchaeota archaeon]|nr:hypothetical protein [Candidatus Lokiarchaeota archaeon]
MNERDEEHSAKKVFSLLAPHSEEKFKNLKQLITQFSQGKLFHIDQMFLRGVLRLFLGDSIKFSEKSNFREIKSQYTSLITQISTEYPKLYEKENNNSRDTIFHKMAYPMEIVRYAFPVYNNSMGFNLYKRLSKFGLELLEIISKSTSVEISNTQLLRILNEFSLIYKQSVITRDWETLVSFAKTKLLAHINIPKKEMEKINNIFDHFLKEAQKQNDLLKKIKEDPTDFGRDLLRVINYIQSHMLYFCRYVRRLLHIREKGNDNYENLYYRHYNFKFEHHEFLDKCNSDLNNYPDLKNYLNEITTQLYHLRNINAHQIPRQFFISPIDGKLCFPVIGQDEYEQINHERISFIMIHYAIFINSIGLHYEKTHEVNENFFMGIF